MSEQITLAEVLELVTFEKSGVKWIVQDVRGNVGNVRGHVFGNVGGNVGGTVGGVVGYNDDFLTTVEGVK